MAQININLACNLQEAVKVKYLNGNLFSQDNQANKINVSVFDGEDEATISGTVTADVIRADGGTVTATGGTISGNVVSIALPAAAYAVPGLVSIVVKLTASGVVTTIACVVATIYNSSTETAIDPGTIIPSVTALVAQIEAAVASIPADYSDLWTSLAPAFSSSASYVAGQYVTYSGGVYRFTTAHSGSWASGDVVAVNLGGEITALKSAITPLQETVGTDIVYKNSVSHASGVTYSMTKFPVKAEQGWKVTVKLQDAGNSGASIVLYTKYEEDSESSIKATMSIGTEYSFISAKTLEYIGFYATGMQSGTLNIEASVQTADNLIVQLENKLDKEDIVEIAEIIGTDVESEKSVVHDASITFEMAKTYIHAEKGWDVSVLVDDSTNAGFSYTLYAKYQEDSSSTSLGSVGVEGVEYHFVSRKTLDFISIYVTSLANAGTATIKVTTKNKNGLVQSVSDIESIILNGYVLVSPNINATFTGAGVITSYKSNRICTGMIEVKIGDKIHIKNGTLKHAVGGWKGTPSTENNIRNDDNWIAADETIISGVNGFYCIVFAKQDETQDISPTDFDGAVELYNTKVGRDSEENDIPSYYFTDNYITDKIDRINELAMAGDDVFIFITDVHWERNAKNSPALINLISKQCVIPRLFDGGDLADTINSGKIAIDSYASSYKNRIYRVVGNHDWFYPATAKSLYYWYNSNNNDQIGDAFGHYWYVDNVQAKIRYVTLNSFIHTGSNNLEGWTYGYDADQIAWFTNEALNVPDGYDVIIFDHWFRKKDGGYPGYNTIESVIASFNADTSSHGKVLCIFQGHAHWDAVFHTSSGVPVITTTCDKYDISNEPEISAEVRTLGTINEQAFEVVIVNRNAETITCVRIGAKAMDNTDVGRTDAGFTFAQTLDERVVSYATN